MTTEQLVASYSDLITSFPPIIGIRDSGAGGLTVARQVRRLLPHIPLMYFADTAHVPYGDRQPAEICHFAFSIAHFLQEHGANLVIFACNTTSAYALKPARQQFDIPLLGMIEGGAEVAIEALTHCRNERPRVGIIATSATVNSHAYSQEITARRPDIQCMEIACPHFVPLVESGKIATPAAFDICAKALEPLRREGIKIVVLGCTHFPLLLPTLRSVAPEMIFVDPAIGVAKQAQQIIKSTFNDTTIYKAADRYFASGATDILRRWIEEIMQPSSAVEILPAPVFSLVKGAAA